MFTPTNQVRLTNVAIVRLRKGKMRFEIACYPNKVTSWRRKLEKNVDEVLQLRTVFTNVSKGLVANADDLQEHFGTADHEKICMIILEKGELQVSEKERAKQLETSFRDIATIVAEKTVNAETKRPYTVNVIERAMKEAHFSVNPSRTNKQQALEVIRVLKAVMPITRAQMRICVACPTANGKAVREAIKSLLASVSAERWEGDFELEALIEPGCFREITDAVQSATKGRGRVDVLQVAVVADDAGAGDDGAAATDGSSDGAAASSSGAAAASSSASGKGSDVFQIVMPDGSIRLMGM